MTDTEQKTITLRSLFAWTVGILFLVTGLSMLVSEPIAALLFIAASFLCLPPLSRLLARKANVQLSTGVRVLLVIVLLGAVGFTSDPSVSSTTESRNTSLYRPPAGQPPLELQSTHMYEEYGYVHIDGMVKNIAGEHLEDVVAVGEFYDDSGTFVKSAEALIDYNPILSGQSSPFSVLTRHNPAIANGRVVFKELWGGTIPMKNGRSD